MTSKSKINEYPFFFNSWTTSYIPFQHVEWEQMLLSQCLLFGSLQQQLLPQLLQPLKPWIPRSQFLHWIPTHQNINIITLSFSIIIVTSAETIITLYSVCVTFNCAQYELDWSQDWCPKWDLITIDLVKEVVNEWERGNCLHPPPQSTQNQKFHPLYCSCFEHKSCFTHLLEVYDHQETNEKEN